MNWSSFRILLSSKKHAFIIETSSNCSVISYGITGGGLWTILFVVVLVVWPKGIFVNFYVLQRHFLWTIVIYAPCFVEEVNLSSERTERSNFTVFLVRWKYHPGATPGRGAFSAVELESSYGELNCSCFGDTHPWMCIQRLISVLLVGEHPQYICL